MCGRFTLTRQDRVELARELDVPADQLPESEYRPRYNIAPSSRHWIVRMQYLGRKGSTGKVEPGLQAEVAIPSLKRWQNITGENQYALAV